MAVYVDDAFLPFRGARYCHMTADSTEELNEMADVIGLQRDWIQRPGTWQEHYDVAPSKRALAIKHGAVERTVREIARMHIAQMKG